MWSLPQLQSSRIILLRHVVFNRYYCILNGCYQTSLPSHTFLPALHHLSHSPVNMSKCPSQHLEHSPSCPPRIYRKRWCSVRLVSLICLFVVLEVLYGSDKAYTVSADCHLQQMGKWISLHWSTKGGSSYRHSLECCPLPSSRCGQSSLHYTF